MINLCHHNFNKVIPFSVGRNEFFKFPLLFFLREMLISYSHFIKVLKIAVKKLLLKKRKKIRIDVIICIIKKSKNKKNE